MRVLIVEDDPKLSLILRDALERNLHRTAVASTGPRGLELASAGDFEAIILDVMLPQMDGYAVARALREQEVLTPILMLTALDATRDIVRGLDSGVDDYLAKPFAFEELFARLRALARRNAGTSSSTYRLADLQLDTVTHLATRSRRRLELTRTEYLLLEFMLRHPYEVLRREKIIRAVWGEERRVLDNTLDAFMKQLRAKVDDPFQTRLIHTIRGFGYKLSAE